MSIPIPGDKGDVHARKPSDHSFTTSVSPPSRKLSADLFDTKQQRRKISTDAKNDAMNPFPGPSLPKRNGTSSSSLTDPFCLVAEEAMKESREGMFSISLFVLILREAYV